MLSRGILVIGLVLVGPTLVAWGQDRVKPSGGGVAVPGSVTEMSPTEVVVRKGPLNKKLNVNEIDYIVYEGEPNELSKARSTIMKGDYQQAATELAKVKMSELNRPEAKADFEFYTALASTKLALGGSGSPAEAGRQLLAFEKNNKNNYHYLAACELLGDLFVSLGKFDNASTYYEKLATAPWPDYKMKAGVLIGRALQGQKKFREAVAKYDEVLAMQGGTGKEVDREQLAATLGRATSLASGGKAEDAIQIVQQVVDATPKENAEAHARAYDALGTCYRLAGKKKEALLAFLHVHLLYSNFSEQHAEALANLAVLWPEVNKGERGAEAKKTLKELYPYSHWASAGVQ